VQKSCPLRCGGGRLLGSHTPSLGCRLLAIITPRLHRPGYCIQLRYNTALHNIDCCSKAVVVAPRGRRPQLLPTHLCSDQQRRRMVMQQCQELHRSIMDLNERVRLFTILWVNSGDCVYFGLILVLSLSHMHTHTCLFVLFRFGDHSRRRRIRARRCHSSCSWAIIRQARVPSSTTLWVGPCKRPVSHPRTIALPFWRLEMSIAIKMDPPRLAIRNWALARCNNLDRRWCIIRCSKFAKI
jgi:hypothetical protein